jgi:hypothetical protein
MHEADKVGRVMRLFGVSRIVYVQLVCACLAVVSAAQPAQTCVSEEARSFTSSTCPTGYLRGESFFNSSVHLRTTFTRSLSEPDSLIIRNRPSGPTS